MNAAFNRHNEPNFSQPSGHRPIELIDENGGGPGVRLRKRHQKKS
jgi:hypothetical protein